MMNDFCMCVAAAPKGFSVRNCTHDSRSCTINQSIRIKAGKRWEFFIFLWLLALPDILITGQSLHSASATAASTFLLPPERASLGQTSLSTSWLTEHRGARSADNDRLCVRENGCNVEASRALDVHEEGSGGRYKSLELVLACLSGGRGIEEIFSENHFEGLCTDLTRIELGF